MTKEELTIKYKVSLQDIEKAFIVSNNEFYSKHDWKVPTPESLCEYWYGDPKLPPVWREQ